MIYLAMKHNRKYLSHISAIVRMKAYSKGKILVELNPPVTEEIIILQEHANDFKLWAGA